MFSHGRTTKVTTAKNGLIKIKELNRSLFDIIAIHNSFLSFLH